MNRIKFLDFIEVNPKIILKKNKIYPFIEMSNVGCYMRSPDRIDSKKFASGVKFEKGDTVISRIEPCLQNGKGFFVGEKIDKGFGSTEFIVFRSKTQEISDKYLFYIMQQHEIRQLMIKSMSGATGRQRVNIEIFNDLEIEIHKGKEKRNKIANILSKYDDLIENNLKRIELLEEAAQRLYKEWFIDLRFPGYEKVQIVDGIPEGWEKKKIKDILIFISGHAFKSKDFSSNGFFKIITIKNVLDGKFNGENCSLISKIPNNLNPECILNEKDIITSLTGNIGRTCLVYGENNLLNQRVSKQKPLKKYYHAFIYSLFRNEKFQKILINLSNGAAQQNLSTKKVEEIEIILNDELVKTFQKNVEKIMSQIIVLNRQNQKLTEARDRLLPKLMKGEIEI